MDAKKLVDQLARHPIVQTEMAMQMQLGLPYLERRNGKLCISFRPHKEILRDNMIEFYPQQYKLAWVYPFNHLIQFENLLYSGAEDYSVPIRKMSLSHYTSVVMYAVEALYAECNRVLTLQQRDGRVSDVALRYYQRAYYEAAEQLGLMALYGGNEG